MITVYYNKNKAGKYALSADCSQGINGVDYNWFFYVGQLIGDRLGGGTTPAVRLLSDVDCSKYKRLIVSAHKSPRKACNTILDAIGKLIADKKENKQ